MHKHKALPLLVTSSRLCRDEGRFRLALLEFYFDVSGRLSTEKQREGQSIDEIRKTNHPALPLGIGRLCEGFNIHIFLIFVKSLLVV